MTRIAAARVAGVLAVGLLVSTSARAQAPVAVVEDVESKSAGVEFMDYVSAGKTIRLGPSDTLVLGYMQSCWRETIIGGTATVGAHQSAVAGGKARREPLSCPRGQLPRTTPQPST